MANSCGGAGGSPLAKGNSGGAVAVGAWVTWANSWDGSEVGPTANPLEGDATAAVVAVAVGGPVERTASPFVADDGPPVEIPPEKCVPVPLWSPSAPL